MPRHDMPEIPYVKWEPNLGTFEYGSTQMVRGKLVVRKIGASFSMEHAKKELRDRGFDLDQPCLMGTRPAAPGLPKFQN